MKKYLFVVDHLNGGGAERITLDLAEALSVNNQVFIVNLNATNVRMNLSKNLFFFEMHCNFDKTSIFDNKRLCSSDVLEFRKIVSETNPDYIIFGYYHGLKLAREINFSKKFCWVHGDILNNINTLKFKYNILNTIRNIKYRYRLKKIFCNSTVIVVNNKIKLDLESIYKNINCYTLYNGIKNKNIFINNEKKWDFIFIGRMSAEKQPEHALEAFSYIKKKNARMLFLGDGPLLINLMRLAKKLNIFDSVDFVGWVTDVDSYLIQSKILVSSSYSEGYGLVISEALSLDVPVIAYNISDGIEFQMNSIEACKYLIEPDNIPMLSLKMNELLENPYVISDEDKQKLYIDRMLKQFLNIINSKVI